MTISAAACTARRRFRILRRPAEAIQPSTPRAQRRDCHGRLGTVLLAMAGSPACIAQARFRPWCSATFIGAQHHMTLRFEGTNASTRAQRFARDVKEAELKIPGHIAADVSVDAIDTDGKGAVSVDLAILTIEDW